MVYVGIMGHGTVGSGVVEVLRKNKDNISKRAGEEIQIKKILDIRDFSHVSYQDLFTTKADDLLEDKDIKIVVEVMGGIEPAYEFTRKALMSGKHVVTSNKELVALHGAELLQIARENNVNYMFEASVGGGIPIIRPLQQCLAANEISEITGILNGTTNYILSEMKMKGKRFDEVLAEAQEKGYAERDPSADIEGYDAQRKIAILSTIAFGQQISFKDIDVKGITHITKEDMLFADELGYVIKLLASSQKDDQGVRARVCPMMLKRSNPLADVNGVFNAILVKGDAIGEVMFYGPGAGKFPTASAVVGDVIDVTKHLEKPKRESSDGSDMGRLLENKEAQTRLFLRVKYEDKSQVEESLQGLFPDALIHYPVHSLLQDELAVVTSWEREADLLEKVQRLPKEKSTLKIMNVIHVEG